MGGTVDENQPVTQLLRLTQRELAAGAGKRSQSLI
jgi:hypothetical protein